MTQETNGSEIDANVIAGHLDIFDHDGHKVAKLIDIVVAAAEAAFNLGLQGEEAEAMAELIQKEIVEVLVGNGIGIIDEKDGKLWLPGTETGQC